MEVPDGTAVEELWENQSYVPIKGWGGPYALMDRYTDITGTITYSDDAFPDIALQEGWMWTTEWTIDTTSAFATDEEGWAYGHTWDRLFDAIQRNLSTADSSTTLVRRRKWIRGRTCVTSSAMEELQQQRDTIISQYNTLKTMIQNKCADYEKISSFRDKYQCDTSSLLHRQDSALAALQRITAQMISHLEEMLVFLEDISQIERDYTAKLTHLSRKYQQRHSHDAPFVLPNASVEGDQSSPQDEAEDGFVEVPQDTSPIETTKDPVLEPIIPIATQFYDTIHNVNMSLESKLGDYCVLLLTITTDVRDQLVRLKEHLKALKGAAQLRYTSHVLIHLVINLRDNISNVQLEVEKCYHTYCTQHNQTTASLTHSLNTYSKHIDSNFTTSRPHLPSLTGCDPYVCYHQYATHLTKHKTLFDTFSSNVANVLLQHQPLSSQYRFVFITTLQLLSHEKNRIFVENSEAFQQMTKSVVSANPRIDAVIESSSSIMPSPLESGDLSDVLCSIPANVASEFGEVTVTITTFGMMHVHAPFSALHSYILKGAEVRDISGADDDTTSSKTLHIRLTQQPSSSILSSGKTNEVVVTCSQLDTGVLLAALSDVMMGVRLVDIAPPAAKKSRRRSSAGMPSNSSSNSVMKKSDDAIFLAQQAMLLAGSEVAADEGDATQTEDGSSECEV